MKIVPGGIGLRISEPPERRINGLCLCTGAVPDTLRQGTKSSKVLDYWLRDR